METLVRDKCPFCSSPEIQFKKKANVWECSECEQRFEQPPLEGVLHRQTDRATRPLTIFLSYGHDDNRPLVDQFKSDLEARGHTVWLDTKDIGTWDDWKGSITQGIHHSELAIAFLSIHSIRDPGVCRNEIAIALNRFGTIYPVLLEKAVESDVPVAIRHLQWPDLSDWQAIRDGEVPDADWKRWYQNKFMEMVAKLEGEATRFADETRVLRQVLYPSSFESRIAQHVPGFVGREWVFDTYRNWLDEQPKSRLFWLKAGPGVGKSAIAANLAHRFRDSVMASWFCEARSGDLTNSDQILKSLSFQLALRLPDFRAQLLRLLGVTANTPDDLCEQAYKELAGKNPADLFRILLAEPFAHLIWREHKLVIVVDALDEATDEQGNNSITDFIANRLAQLPEWVGFVVTSRPEAAITSRLQGFKPFELEAHDARNVADLNLWYGTHLGQQPVLRTLPEADQQRLQRLLIERSDGMILYLKMVAQGLDEGSLRIADLEHLESGLPGLFGHYYQSFVHRFGNAYETEVKPLLRLLLAASPLPEDLLREVLQQNSEEFLRSRNALGSYLIETPDGFELFHKTLGEWLGSRQSGPFFVERQLGMQAVADALFAELEQANDVYQARWHRLAALHLPLWLNELKQRDDPAALIELSGALRFLARCYDAELLSRRALAIRRATMPAGHVAIATCLNNLATLLEANGNYDEAEPLYREALAIWRTELPIGHPQIALGLGNLATLLDTTGHYDEAELLCREALSIRRISLADRHLYIALSLNNLAHVLAATGRYDEAKPLLQEALAIRRTELPAGHPDIAQSLNNLASLLAATHGSCYEAEPLYREALEISRTALSPGHPDIALVLNNLSVLLGDIGSYDKAELLCHEALGIRRASLPPGHIGIAQSLNTLATLLAKTNRYDEAETLYREALDIQRAALNADHPDIIQSINNLAYVLKAIGRSDEAVRLYIEALNIRRAALDANHPSIAESLNNLANMFYATDHYDEAEPLYREALDIRRTAPHADRQCIAVSLNNLANLFYVTGRYDEAEPLFHEALAIRRATLHSGHPDIAVCLDNVASLLLTTGRCSEVEPFLRELIALQRESTLAEREKLPVHMNNLAYVLGKAGNFTEAESLHQESLAIYCQNLPEGHEYIGCVKQNYARTLVAAGRAAEAENLLQDALAIYRKTLPPDHEWTQSCLSDLAELQRSTGRPFEAEVPLSLDGAS